MQFAWRRVVLKEYGSADAWCAGALLLLSYDTLSSFDYNQRRLYLNVLAILLVVITAVWITIRWLKKSQRLTE